MLTAQQLSYMIEQNTVAERMIVLFSLYMRRMAAYKK